MRKLILFTILFTTALSFSQQSTEVGDFSELKVYDLITVKLVPANDNKVVVAGANTESVKIINESGVLKVRMELEERFDGNNTTVTVYFKEIAIIDANEGAKIYSEDEISSPSLELKTQEGGKIGLKISVENLLIKSVSGGVIETKGTARNQTIAINSGGAYEGKNLMAVETTVNVTAGGFAEIYTTEKVDAKVTAGGSIKVFGNPKNVKKKKRAGGNIEIVKTKN